MIVAILLALLGMALSAYLMMHHLQVKAEGGTNAACNINATFSCDEVAKSKYSEVLGIPLGVFGLGYFLAMAVLAVVSLLNPAQRREHMQTYAVMAAVGVATSLGLAGISAFGLGTFCIVCIGVYAVNLVQAGVLIGFRRNIPSGFAMGNLFNGGMTAVIAVAVVVVGFNFLAPKVPAKSPEDTQASDNPALNAEPLAVAVQNIPVDKSPYSGLGEDFRSGSDSAKVVIVEFADFECPACRRMSEVMRMLKKEYGQKILVVFKNYPLDQACNPSITHAMHKSSCTLATLARCAGQFGKFWDFHDLAFDNQTEASPEKAKEWAKTVGLSDDQINACNQDKSIVEKMRDDMKIANSVGLTGTPTVFINGRKYVGDKGIVEMRQLIDGMLATN
jgi:protein-disulfide isomerase/uncharacterized membrane protein